MRLICPNCSAQYEIDTGMIPDEGRDVQCSNCGHTWYELPPPPAETAQALATDVDLEEPEFEAEYEAEGTSAPDFEDDYSTAQDDFEAELSSEPEPEPADAEPQESSSEADESWDWPDEEVEKEKEPLAATARRPADVAALDILREEAEREIAQRKGDAPAPIESQSEFGLEEPAERDTPSRALRARMARLRGEEESDDEPKHSEADYHAPRRDLLPDIEEINSSLRPSDKGAAARTPEQEDEHRRGFRVGFAASVLFAALLIIFYAWAPGIASAIPAAEPALISYVDWANSARDALDGLIGG